MDLKRVFDGISEKMKIDFEDITSQIHHNLSKGREREGTLIQEYLRKYLPKNLGLASGEIISSDGQVSGECDVVIFDETQCPIFMRPDGYRVFPNECVYGVIEVKSFLDNTSLKETQEKLTSIKKMPKNAFFIQHGEVRTLTQAYGEKWNYFPTSCMIFAYDSIDLTSLRKTLDALQNGLEFHHRVESIWVLKKGFVINWIDSEKTMTSTPESDTRLRALSSDNILLPMTVNIQSLFHGAWMPQFRIEEYYRIANILYGEYLEP